MEERLKVELLGQFRVSLPSGELRELNTPRLRALLGRLVLAEGMAVDRAELAFSFWPDSTETHARGNLRKLLHVLSRRLPDLARYLDVDERSITWRADAPASVDVIQFEQLCRSEHVADWRRAAELYGGPLLPGSYQQWVLDERDALSARFTALLGRLADVLEAEGQFAQAAAVVERQLREQPSQESAWGRLIRLYAASGDRAQALKAYQRCRRALEEELGAEPSGEIEELNARVRQAADGPLPLPAFRAAPGECKALRLIGRDDATRRLQAWAHAAFLAPRPLLLLVEGEAGLGKTALAEELAAWARAQGYAVHWGQAYEPDRDIAFAPVRHLFHDSSLLEAGRALPAQWRSELARLVPEIEPEPAAPPSSARAGDGRRQQMFAALSSLFATVGRPLLLVADDLQWWDGASLAWLHYLLGHAQGRPLVVLATLRPEVESPEPLPALVASLEALGAIERFELEPLGVEATSRLLAQLTQQHVTFAEASSAHAQTEGNPLFIMEWVEATSAGVAAAAHSYEFFLDPVTGLPRRVHGLIMGRLLALSAEARRVAEAGAVLGRSFGWPLMRRMVEGDDGALVDALEELFRRRVLRENSALPHEERSYDFAHGRIRDVVEARLSMARRRFLHERAVIALAEVYGDDERFAAQRGAHHAVAGRPLEAARQFARAGQVALEVYANEQAIAHFLRALELLPEGEGGASARRGTAAATGADEVWVELRAEVAEDLGEVLYLVGRHEEAAVAFVTASEAAALLSPEPLRRARLLRKRGNAKRDAHRHEAAEALYDEAESLLVGRLDPPERTGSASSRALVDLKFERLDLYYRAGRQPEMTRLVAEMARLVAESVDPRVRSRYHHTLALLEHRRNRFVSSTEEIEHVRESLAAAHLARDPQALASAHFSFGFVQLWAGELELATEHLAAGLEGAAATGNLLLEVRALTYLGIVARLKDERERVEALLRRASELAYRAELWEYIAAAHAQAAWLATVRGLHHVTRDEGRRALALWTASATAFPFRWLAAFPLLRTALHDRDLDAAAPLGQTMLEPSQQRLPRETERALSRGLAAFRKGDRAETERLLGVALGRAPGAGQDGGY